MLIQVHDFGIIYRELIRNIIMTQWPSIMATILSLKPNFNFNKEAFLRKWVSDTKDLRKSAKCRKWKI